MEVKTKQTEAGSREYRYYRCARYTIAGHPRCRVREHRLDDQVTNVLKDMKLNDASLQVWFAKVLAARGASIMQADRDQVAALERQRVAEGKQLSQLLNLRLGDEIDANTFAAKQAELRVREAEVLAAIQNRGGSSENLDLPMKVFELSQFLEQKWVESNIAEKRQLLDILCLNLTLDDVNLCLEMRKPFDLIAKGLVPVKTRGDWI